MKRVIFLLILAIFTTSASGEIIFSDDFESGTLDQWIIGGRQQHSHGGVSMAEVVNRHGSQMAHLHQSDFTEITLEKMFAYKPNLSFSFDAEVNVSSDTSSTSADYAMGGAFFGFLDSAGELIGFVRYTYSTSSYPFTTYNPSPSREYIALPYSSLHSYSFTLEDILSHITVDTDSITSVNFSFWAYNSGWGWNMSADVWVDNVVVSVPELVGLEIAGPNEVAENFSASYKAMAYYDDDSTRDVTDSALWVVEPNTAANIDDYGVLTTKDIVKHQSATILASYTEGEVTVEAEKAIDIFAICPTGTALQFDGVDDYVSITPITLSTNWTLSGWFKVSYDIDNVIIGGPGTYTNFVVIQHNADDIALETNTNADTVHICHGVVNSSIGQWAHYTITRTGRTVSGYKNGIFVDSDTLPIGDDNTITKIGSGYGTAAYHHYKGSMDEVAIYEMALSAEEIQANMHKRLAGDETNLVGYWDFDEGGGQIAYDLSVSGNDGQLGSTLSPDASDPAWIDSDAPIGICTTYLIARRATERALWRKLALLDELLAALAEEWAAYEALEELLESGDYGDLNKGDIVTAKQKIHSAIRTEEQSIGVLEKSIEKLEDALSALEPPILNQPPNVTITKPQDGAVFGASETIEIEANAWDVDGSVVKVEFFADESKIGEDNDGTDGWKSSWNNHPAGSYSLTAKATDNDGAAATSPAVGIMVVETPLPGQASNPNPADGATSVSLYADLSWTAGSNAASHDVYFGMTSPGAFRGNQTATTFDPGTMAYTTMYYWRIDEVNAGGTTTGTVWSFTTGGPR